MKLEAAILLAAITGLATAAPSPKPQTISGQARVLDGDTLVVGRVHIRLFGIDAPELEQRCTDADNHPINCGLLAADVLAEEIGGAIVVCFPLEQDKYSRTVAVCTAKDKDLARAMVERGFALDYEFYSGGRYAGAEREARQAKRGLWAGTWKRLDD